jgi:hypothetical protein
MICGNILHRELRVHGVQAMHGLDGGDLQHFRPGTQVQKPVWHGLGLREGATDHSLKARQGIRPRE